MRKGVFASPTNFDWSVTLEGEDYALKVRITIRFSGGDTPSAGAGR
ncbi:MAG: hypothetical protein ACLQGU_19065 [bacterium]